MSKSNEFLKGDALQDQEIAAGRDWLKTSSPKHVRQLFDSLNNGVDLSKLSQDEMQVVRSLALIGFWEIARERT